MKDCCGGRLGSHKLKRQRRNTHLGSLRVKSLQNRDGN